MINNILEMFQFDFFIRALIVGSILSVIFSILWNYIIMRKESNIVHTISNFWLLWIAIWLYFSFDLNISIIITTLIWTFLLIFIKKNWFFWNDSINEIIAQFWLIISIIIVSQLSWYRSNILNFLFGDILTITQNDLIYSLIIGLIVILFYIFLHKKFFEISFSPELAISKWTNIKLINTIFMLILSLSIAISIKIIWVLLVSAFLILPANISKSISKNFRQLIIVSVIIWLIWLYVWLISSYIFDIPSGVWIVFILCIMFMITFIKKII